MTTAPGTTAPVSLPSRLPLILVLATITCYVNALDGPFQFDDILNIEQNPLVRNFHASSDLLALFLSCPTRFVGFLSFALNASATGLSPGWFHAFNIAVHTATVLLVYALAKRGLGQHSAPLAAFAGALFFAVHPVQTQAVTYIVQRFASLAACFYLATLLTYLAGVRRPRLMPLAWLCAVGAYMTKENAITLPAAVLAIELLWLKAPRRQMGRRLLPIAALALLPVLALTLFGHNNALQLSLDKGESPPLAVFWMTQAHVLFRYLQLIVWPTGQNLDYTFPLTRTLDLSTALLLLLPLALLYLAWRWRRRSPVACFGMVLFFLGLAVECLVPLPDLIFEHRLYLPMAGVALMIAAGLDALSRPPRQLPPWLLGSAYACLALALGVATWQRNEVWRSGTALWADVLAKAPDNDRAYDNLAAFLVLEDGDIPAALAVAEHWRRLHPAAEPLILKMADYLERLDRAGEAVSILREGRASFPRSTAIALALPRILIAAGRPEEAVAAAEEARSLAPEEEGARVELALALLEQKASPDVALAALALAQGHEAHASAMVAMGRILQARGDELGALNAFDAAETRQPSNTEACLRATESLSALQRSAEASARLRRCPIFHATDYRLLARSAERLAAAAQLEDAAYAYAVALELCQNWHPACARQGELQAKLAALPGAPLAKPTN